MTNERAIKIKVQIMRKGLTGSKIAKRLGVTREYVNANIRGVFKTPWVREEICKILELPMSIWDEEDTEKAA